MRKHSGRACSITNPSSSLTPWDLQVIALLWVRHHSFYRGIDRIDTRLTVLNLTYLGLIAFMPYPTRILGLYGHEPAAVVLYATTAATVAVVARLESLHSMRAALRR